MYVLIFMNMNEAEKRKKMLEKMMRKEVADGRKGVIMKDDYHKVEDGHDGLHTKPMNSSL